jgi:hypothetical protein
MSAKFHKKSRAAGARRVLMALLSHKLGGPSRKKVLVLFLFVW